MFSGMIGSMLPVALLQLQKVGLEQKQGFAMFIADCCTAYAQGDRDKLAGLLDKVGIPPAQRPMIDKALWG